jgi:hypothetical protein
VPTDRSVYLNGDEKDPLKQKFAHTRLPDKRTYLAWDRARQQALEDQEWDRRLNGVWFFNCGVPTYLTGRNYNFLNYHRYKKNARPFYREADLEFFWVWEYIAEHVYSYGMYLHSRRRWGKTSKSASIGTEAATRIPNFRFGMASKTDKSAQKSIFQGEVIRPLKALRDCPWFMPKLVGKIDPANDLEFGSPSTTAKAAQQEVSSADDLTSWIGWFLPTPNAADSDDLDFFFNDEVAKEQVHDAYKRWETVKPQFVPDGVIKGKAICATTTDLLDGEDDEGEKVVGRSTGTSAKQAKKWWNNSDHTQLQPGEYTESGLFRLFIAANKGFLTDEYGRDTQEGIDHYLRIRARLNGTALINEKRRNPLTIDEALLEPVNENSEFNAEHIQQNLDAIEAYELATGKKLAKRYRLEWKNPVTWEPPVRAVPDDKAGPWQFAWLPNAEHQNQVLPMGFVTDKSSKRWRSYKPMNVDMFDIGVDPIQRKFSSVTNKKKASSFAISVFRPWDPGVERQRGQPTYWPSNGKIGRYNNRPENAATCYEELFKACYFFGCEASVEKQTADALFEMAEERGFDEFMADKVRILEGDQVQQQAGPGTAASAPTVGRMVQQYGQYVTDFMGSELTTNSRGEVGINDAGIPYDFRRNPFKESLRDNRDFDMEDRKKSDDTMAELNAYSHSRRLERRTWGEQGDDEQGLDAQVFDPSQYFR